MKVILSHSGKQHSYYVAKALEAMGILDTFFTSSYIRSRRLQHFFTWSNNDYFTRRFIDGVSGKQVDANWRFEVREIILRKLFGKSKKAQDAVYARDVNFDRYVARKIRSRHRKKNDLSGAIFWGFQGSCFESLQAAKEAGMITVVELATAHVTASIRILGEEQELVPEWADSIDNLYFPKKYLRRLEQEPLLADYVVVASRFTLASLEEAGVRKDRICYLPLGVDTHHIPVKKTSIKNSPLKLLYAGTITQRKGIKYLLEAISRYDSAEVELHIYGHTQGSGKAFKEYESLPQLYYHGPVSQRELFGLYSAYDFLVLPTVFEGFGLVIVEAMAAGLPVVTTEHSFGAELIKEAENGFLVPIRDAEAIKDCIDRLNTLDDEGYAAMSLNARKSAEGVNWSHHAKELKKLIDGLVSGK